ncbi:MAG: insulinase family protein [Firmicutes bacterium]|nr:insulinase family protein [[Eubacterium] siraeum]MCM1488185.1 insulinase family protein [Bacillota bacterium]
MNLSAGARLKGFSVTQIREEKELGGKMVEMLHDKTGAKLCWIDNGEENKLFCVSFKTLPENSTGVFHILEHSVLCGSDKYPVKEPFVDLLKSSMNTFLNAMTFPDKTIYPVSSRNKRDFLNLTSVYLDAVFAPKLLENPSVFHQEGIHTEFNDGVPSYKGVVFNEMKGAMSGIDDRIEEGIMELLFPHNCYRFNSGGDPAVIPDLTYEKYRDTYCRFYHPSNAKFFLDGDIPLEETLELIDSYLSKKEKSDLKFEVEIENPAPKSGTWYYEIGENDDPDKKAALVFGKIVGTWKEKDKILASQVLCDVLAGTNESPLKRAVLSSGLAEDFEMRISDGIAQPFMVMAARNISEKNGDRIAEIIADTVDKLISKGLDGKSLSASINRFAFQTKQLPEPQGLYRAILAENSWLYGGDPMDYLLYDKSMENLRREAENGGFEKLLKELLGDRDSLCVLKMLPSKTLGAELRKTEEERLQKETGAFTEADKKANEELNKKLTEWQTTPDSAEAAASLPKLPLSEVSEKPRMYRSELSRTDEARVIYHPVSTHGIVYIRIYFPLTDLSLKELSAASFLPLLYGELPTKNYSILELQQMIKTYIGKLGFKVDCYGDNSDVDRCMPCLEVAAGILKENLDEAKKLIIEIINNTEFDHPDKIKEIAAQAYENEKQNAMYSGHVLARTEALAQYTAKNAVNEAICGYSFINALKKLSKDFDKEIAGFTAVVDKIYGEAITKNGITVSVTAEEEQDISDIIKALPDKKALEQTAEYKTELPERMGIVIPAQISFAAQALNLPAMDKRVSGALKVAANIISFSYLWNVIRVQGGAYGAGIKETMAENLFCYTYRDPSPARSLGVYGGIGSFVKEYCDSDEELEKYIISAIANGEPLLSPEQTGYYADCRLFSGITDEDRTAVRKEMLTASKDQLRELCGFFDEMARDAAVCVVGYEDSLKECGELTFFEL